MAKFYVTCGELKELVEADDSRQAALWAMHLMMEQIVPLDELEWEECNEVAMIKYEGGFSDLGTHVQVSERGFENHDSGNFETENILKEWNQLLVAVARIDRLTSKNGLSE